MASGILGADEEQSRVKNRWSRISKVYTRKFRKGNTTHNNNNNNNNNTPIPITASLTTDNQSNENDNNDVGDKTEDNNDVATNSSHVVNGTIAIVGDELDNNNNDGDKTENNVAIDNSHAGNGTIAIVMDEEDNESEKDNDDEEDKDNDNDNDKDNENVNDDEIDNKTDNAPQNSLPTEIKTKDANSLQVQQNLPDIEIISEDSSSPNRQHQQNLPQIETISEDSLSPNRAEATVPNGYHGNLANGGYTRPVVTQVDDRVSICVSAARSTEEVNDLKRKLEGELDQVRKMARRLEAKEIELNGYCSSEIGVGFNSVPPVGNLQFPVNGVVEKGYGFSRRVISDVGSVGFNDSRPFRHLSVSVMDNNHHGVGEIVEKEKRTPKANQYYRNSEFLLGKEKLPPIESNRKSKSSGGGRRHGGRDFDYGFGADKQLFKNCNSLLTKLMKHKHGWVFNTPVDVAKLGLHDYYDIIKHPMDLGTVKSRMNRNWYKTPREFAEDVRLTFHNALTYNPEGQDVHIMARDLLRIFEEKWPSIEAEYDRKLRYETFRDFGVPTPTSRKTYAPSFAPTPMPLAPPQLHHPPPFQEVRHLERSQSMPYPPEPRSKPVYPVARAPALKKPKAKDLNKRDMTFEEKQKLSTNLQSLPSEKLDAIVQIIKKRNSTLSQHDDEIEVDIDSVDAETLWELDRFVTNYRKSLSKHKRKAELALQARAHAAQAAQETIAPPASIEATKEARTDVGNVAPPQHVSQEKHSDNASGSSSSSSSSSDSGSSSSDSDSDSSSGSGSDGGH